MGDSGDDRDGAVTSPRMDLPPNTIVKLGRRDDPLAPLMTVIKRIPAIDGRASVVLFENKRTGETPEMTDDELAIAAASNGLHLLVDPDGTPIHTPPTLAELDEDERAHCARCKAYVDACLGLGSEFRRSRPVLSPVIVALAKARQEAKAPSFSSVLTMIERWQLHGERFGAACFARHRNPGNTKRTVVVGDVKTALDVAVIKATRMPKGTAEAALLLVHSWFAENRTDQDLPTLPCLKTVGREMARMNRFIAEDLRYGTKSAEAKYAGKYERPRPEMPLLEVECDHTLIDVLVFDENREVLFGRPDIITFRDRCTGCVLGIHIGFDAPSYASFLSGLEHAYYPKDMSEFPNVETPWFCYGRFKRLYVDNAMHFIGNNIRNAGANLGIELVEFLPGNPWLKGAQEGLFRILNQKIHNLPGSVFSNVEERKRYVETGRIPVLTITELRGFLVHYVCDVYHRDTHEGLGFLRTLKDIPRRLWNERIKDVLIPPPPPRENFASLAGDTRMVAVTTKGVVWDHVRYQSPALDMVRSHPDHRPGKEEKGWAGRKYRGTKYRATRHPSDIGRILIHNPHRTGPRVYDVPAIRQDYAAGLSLHQHRVFVANSNAKVLAAAAETETELLEAKRRVVEMTVDLLHARKKYDIAKRLATFVGSGRSHHDRSMVHTATESEATDAPMDPTRAKPLPQQASRSKDSAHATPKAGTAKGASRRIATSDDALPVMKGPVAPATREAPPTAPADTDLRSATDLRSEMETDDLWRDM